MSTSASWKRFKHEMLSLYATHLGAHWALNPHVPSPEVFCRRLAACGALIDKPFLLTRSEDDGPMIELRKDGLWARLHSSKPPPDTRTESDLLVRRAFVRAVGGRA